MKLNTLVLAKNKLSKTKINTYLHQSILPSSVTSGAYWLSINIHISISKDGLVNITYYYLFCNETQPEMVQKVNPSSRGRCLIQYLFTIPIDSVLEQWSQCAKCYVIINSNKLSPRPFPHSPIMNILWLATTKASTLDYDNVLGRALGWMDRCIVWHC